MRRRRAGDLGSDQPLGRAHGAQRVRMQNPVDQRPAVHLGGAPLLARRRQRLARHPRDGVYAERWALGDDARVDVAVPSPPRRNGGRRAVTNRRP